MTTQETVPFKWIKGARIDSEHPSAKAAYLAICSEDGVLVTLKQAEMPRDDLDAESKAKAESAVESLRKEFKLLSGLKHPNVIECYGAEETAEAFNVFLEYLPAGSVESLVAKYGALEEKLAKSFVRNIVEGVIYLHSQSIVLRAIASTDVCLDNKGICKIAELSNAERLTPGTGVSASHPASEASSDVKKKPLSGKSDIWGIGCVILRMLGGESAGLEDPKPLEERRAPPIPDTMDLSPEAKDFLQQCLRLDPEERPTAENLLTHSWLTPTST